MGLHHQDIAAVLWTAALEPVIETHFQCGSGGLVGGDMATDTGTVGVGLQYHRHRVPANDVLDLLLQRDIAGIAGLLLWSDGISIGGVQRRFGQANPLFQQMILQ